MTYNVCDECGTVYCTIRTEECPTCILKKEVINFVKKYVEVVEGGLNHVDGNLRDMINDDRCCPSCGNVYKNGYFCPICRLREDIKTSFDSKKRFGQDVLDLYEQIEKKRSTTTAGFPSINERWFNE